MFHGLPVRQAAYVFVQMLLKWSGTNKQALHQT